MSLRTTWHNTISTPIPSSLTPSQILSILHDHGFLITMSPIVTRYEIASEQDTATTGGERIKYNVWENIDFLPFGLWKQEIKFNCWFENDEGGVTSWIKASLGLVSKAEYSLKSPADSQQAEGDGLVLNEEVESECNWFLRAFVEATLVKTREEMHGRILEGARKRGGEGGGVQ